MNLRFLFLFWFVFFCFISCVDSAVPESIDVRANYGYGRAQMWDIGKKMNKQESPSVIFLLFDNTYAVNLDYIEFKTQ